MAKRRGWSNQNRGFSRVKRRKKRKYTEVEKAAYMQGLVERGLKNPNSLVSAAYSRGVSEPTPKKPRKSLF